MYKAILLICIQAIWLAYSYEVPAITSQHQNILRSYGNLGQVSTYSKTLDTPFSSVRKADVRISNPGYAVPAPYAHAAYPSPYAHAAYPTPYAHAAYPSYPALAPALHHGPLVAPVAKAVAPAGLLGVAYSPATAVSHMTYTNGLGISYEW